MINNQNIHWGLVLRNFISDPNAKHYMRMRDSLWLYLYFLTSVGKRTGRIVTTLERIAKDMGVTVEMIQIWLGVLKKYQYIQVIHNYGQTIFQVSAWKKTQSIF
jgi:hypothetical protein